MYSFGEVYANSKKTLSEHFPICRYITLCATTETATTSGGTTQSSDGELFDVMERKNHSTTQATGARATQYRMSMIRDRVRSLHRMK